jgi:hypothetical protein
MANGTEEIMNELDHITPQATFILKNEDWDGGLGWNVNIEALPEIIDILRRKANEAERAVRAYNFSCVTEADCAGDQLQPDRFPPMDEREYWKRYYGPNPAGLQVESV